MQSNQSFIQRYSIGDFSEDKGLDHISKDFHVFTSEEVTLGENIVGRPVRSDHFSVALVVKGEVAIKYNLIDYILPKNSLFIITPR